MASVYPAKITLHAIPEIVNKHNLLVDLLGKDLSSVVEGGGVGDVKSPIFPGAIDDTVVLFDGTSGKQIKASTIYADWFDQSVATTASPVFVMPTVTGLQFDILETPPDNAEGLLRWNATDGTLDLGMSGGTVAMQLGQELFVKVINKTGVTIPNGSAVYFNGRQGNRPKIELAKSDAPETSYVMGLTTQDIADNTEGYITTFGYVRQIKTDYATWAEGQPLYVSDATAGVLTNVEPDAPHHADIVGYVGVVGGLGIGSIFVSIKRHADLETLADVDGNIFDTNGQVLTYNADTGIHIAMSQFPVSHHYTGFPDRTSTSLGWDDGTYTFTLTATDDPVWIDGLAYNIDTLTKSLSVAQEAVSGLYWFWLTVSSNVISLNCDTGHPGWDKCLVATVYWNTTTSKGILSDERHWMGRDKFTHEYLHKTIGARYASGLTGTFTDTTFEIAAGVFFDEDIEHTFSSAMTTAKVLYHNGDSDWAWDELTTPYKAVNPGVDDSLRYNSGTALATADNNKYVNQFVFITNDVSHPVHIVIGTTQHVLLTDARSAPIPSLGALTSAENKLIYRITYRNSGGSPEYIETMDYRSLSGVSTSTYVATDHGTLAGLTDLDHPASAIINTPAGDISATDVQAAINELDTEKLPTAAIDDTAYGAGWDTDTTHAPTKNAVYGIIGTPLSGTKVYYVADTSGGATTRKLTFVNGILTSET
jgi:hypothetical protein